MANRYSLKLIYNIRVSMKIQEWKLFFFPNPQRNIYTIATIICLVLILLQAILTVYFWFHAPLRIPIHYNMKGLPDRYGNKNNIWSLLLISTVLFILLTGLIRSKFIYKNFKSYTITGVELLNSKQEIPENNIWFVNQNSPE